MSEANFIAAARGWAAVFLTEAGAIICRPIAYFGSDDGIPWVWDETRLCFDTPDELPRFTGVVGPDQDCRLALRAQIEAALKKLPTPKREDDVSATEHFRTRHP